MQLFINSEQELTDSKYKRQKENESTGRRGEQDSKMQRTVRPCPWPSLNLTYKMLTWYQSAQEWITLTLSTSPIPKLLPELNTYSARMYHKPH